MAERWIGEEVPNSQVASTIRKKGAPAHTRAAGEKTILYYPNPEYSGEGEEKFEDQAGKERTSGKVRIVQKPRTGAEISSSIATLSKATPIAAAPSASPISTTVPGDFANPEDVVSGGERSFSFSELDARDKADLEKLYEKHVGPIGELKGTGSNGAVLKKDLVNALRSDR